MENQVIVITGARGTGKSILAGTFLPPSQVNEVYVHDSENSHNSIVANLRKKGLAYGRYVDLKARFSDLPSDDDLLAMINKGQLPWVGESERSTLAQYYEYVLEDLAQNLVPGQYKVYVHDTLEKLEAGMVAWVASNKAKVKVGEYAPYGRFWNEAVYPLYEHFLAALARRGLEAVILCSHLKTPWEGKKPIVGKVIPSGKKLLYRLSSLMLWLVNDRRNSDGAPAGLVLKERLGKLEVEGQDWSVRRMLPERIPHCTWKDINRYLENGCDLAEPAEGERMSEAERGMISELLTDEQMRLMILDAERELLAARQNSGLFTQPEGQEAFKPPVPESEVVALAGEGLSAPEIAERLNRPLPVVLAEMSSENK